jgi:electron transport complex protein RnfB
MPNAAPIAIDAILPRGPGLLAVARIDEARCIGCTLCVSACPFDAIVGAAKLMHTVISERCTGCELCLPPCPVDCIAMLADARSWTEADAELARDRFARRRARHAGHSPAASADKVRRQAAVAAALARARERRARTSRGPR